MDKGQKMDEYFFIDFRENTWRLSQWSSNLFQVTPNGWTKYSKI